MNSKSGSAQSSLESLRHIREKLGLTNDKWPGIIKEIDALEEMIEKLENGVIEIAVFGEVSSGKSSLLNALLEKPAFEVGARHGVTATKGKHEWHIARKEIQSEGQSRVVLVDTPGINEVDGKERAQLAKDTIRDTDLVIFVVKSDLNEVEFDAIKELHASHKPIIVAFNKVDTYSKHQREVISDAIMSRLDGLIQKNRVVQTASDPIEREVLIEKPDGSEQIEVRKPLPIVEELKDQIFAVLKEEGKELVALNAAIFAAGISERIAQEKVAFRKKEANELIEKYMWYKAAGVALNPFALADIAGGVIIDAYMVHHLGKIYGINVSFSGGQELIGTIVKSMGTIAGMELATHLVVDLAKTGTGGLATVVTAVPQAAAGAWGTYVVGQASHVYFANGGGWGEKGPKQVIREILDFSDKESILAPIKEGIKNKILFRQKQKR